MVRALIRLLDDGMDEVGKMGRLCYGFAAPACLAAIAAARDRGERQSHDVAQAVNIVASRPGVIQWPKMH
jgi:hypothetical protein